MTKKNVVLPDTMSMYDSISMLLKKLRTERTNVVSSPTSHHVKSTQEEEVWQRDTWIVQRPSALNMLDEITNAAKGKQIIMFLDYDGTLSPIVDDADGAFISEPMRTTVSNLSHYFPTTILTGRCIQKVYSFIELPQLYYAGSHRMDIKGPTVSDSKAIMFQPATEFLPMIDDITRVLFYKTKFIPGAKVENSKFCVRCVDERSWSAVAELVKEELKNYPKLRLTKGKKVLEIRPRINWHKGKALEFLLESLGYANSNDVFPIRIGDNRTDEDAIKVLRQRGEGCGILVSKIAKQTSASYTLKEPCEVMEFLQRFVSWKRVSCEE